MQTMATARPDNFRQYYYIGGSCRSCRTRLRIEKCISYHENMWVRYSMRTWPLFYCFNASPHLEVRKKWNKIFCSCFIRTHNNPELPGSVPVSRGWECWNTWLRIEKMKKMLLDIIKESLYSFKEVWPPSLTFYLSVFIINSSYNTYEVMLILNIRFSVGKG